MSDKLYWLHLHPKLEKSYNCKKLLPDPGAEVIEDWAISLAETTEQLVIAREMLHNIYLKFKDKNKQLADEIWTILELTNPGDQNEI